MQTSLNKPKILLIKVKNETTDKFLTISWLFSWEGICRLSFKDIFE
ncbi:MAG: hypothetical protein M1276_05605 [Deltaproteobacteria bacterium]|nr:hypothetical protein [Deltaproteobacteria bacterium]